MAIEVLAPDGLIADVGHSSCALSDLTGDDGNWCIAASKTQDTSSHVDFPTPAVQLGRGANRQKILTKVRQFSGNDSALPTARIELWENGSLVRAGSNQTVPASGTKTLTLLFNANELSNQDGSLVQVKVITTAETEPGFSGSVDTGFIEFTADSLNSDSITGSITTTFIPAAAVLSFNNAHEISGSVTTTFTPSATLLHKQNLAIVGDVTVNITVDASMFFTVFGSRETLLPDGLISDSGHSACLLSDLTADDANWCVAASKSSSTEMHVDFPTPTNLLEVGAGFQKITAIVTQNAANEPSAPTARIELWEGGSLVRAGSNVTVPPTGIRTLIFNFNANELADVHGQNVQAKVITVADTEPGFSGSVDTGYIAFDANIIPLNFFSIAGSITTSFVPGATLQFQQHPQITGDVTTTFTPVATLAFTGHAQIIGDVTVVFNINATLEFTIAGGDTEILVPNTKIADSGHSACLLSDLTADDANWCIAASKTASTETHVGYPTPTELLEIGVNKQKITAIVRQFSGNEPSIPQARIELWENGSLVRAGANQSIFPTGTKTLTLNFNGNELSDSSGLNVEAKVITTADTEPGFSGSVDTGYIAFTARLATVNSIVGSLSTSFTPSATMQFQQHPQVTGDVTTNFTPSATVLFTGHPHIFADVTVVFNINATLEFTVSGGVTEVLVPDTKIGDSGHSACLLSDLTADDANWCIAATKTSNTESHVGYPTPTNLLEIGAGFQKITAIVRQFSGNEPALPSARIELWEGGSLVRAGPNVIVGPTGTKTITFNFNANELADTHGQNVEAKVITVADTEPGFSGAVDTGYIAFTARYIPINNFAITGSLSTSFTPGATLDFTAHEAIVGSITVNFTIAATMAFTVNVSLANITTGVPFVTYRQKSRRLQRVTPLPFVAALQSFSIVGSITSSFVPGATMQFQQRLSITGDVTATFTPAATMLFLSADLFTGASAEKLKLVSLTPRRRLKFFQRRR